MQKQSEKKSYKVPAILKYISKLFEFEISDALLFCENQKNNLDLNEKMVKGFDVFLESLNKYFDIYQITSVEYCQIRIFGSVTLNNGAILHARNEFFNKPWFSNIAITMHFDEIFDYSSDSGTCYAQVYFNKI